MEELRKDVLKAIEDAVGYCDNVCDDRYNSAISEERKQEVISILQTYLEEKQNEKKTN